MDEEKLKDLERLSREQGGIAVVPQEQTTDFLHWMMSLGNLSPEERKRQIALLFPETGQEKEP